jgi:hypothetical protein
MNLQYLRCFIDNATTNCRAATKNYVILHRRHLHRLLHLRYPYTLCLLDSTTVTGCPVFKKFFVACNLLKNNNILYHHDPSPNTFAAAEAFTPTL